MRNRPKNRQQRSRRQNPAQARAQKQPPKPARKPDQKPARRPARKPAQEPVQKAAQVPAQEPARDARGPEGLPPLLPPDQMPAVRTQADLSRTWRALMGDLGFADRRVWLLFLEPDGRLLGPLLSIEDLPDGPYDHEVDDLVTMCRDILDGPGGGGSVAILITRPGGDAWHVGDRAWGRYLTAAAHRIGGQVWPVHRANDRELTMVPAEEVGGRESA